MAHSSFRWSFNGKVRQSSYRSCSVFVRRVGRFSRIARASRSRSSTTQGCEVYPLQAQVVAGSARTFPRRTWDMLYHHGFRRVATVPHNCVLWVFYPRPQKGRCTTPRRETSHRSHPRRVQPKVEPVLEPKPDVYRPSYPQQGAQGYAQYYYLMANSNQPGGTLPFADVDRPMETQSQSFLHQPTQVLLGPSVPYLQPLTTMLEPFRFVIDYRAYRLMNQREQPYADELGRMHKLTRKVNALFPNLAKFDGTKPNNQN